MGDSGGLHLCTWRKESARRIYLGLLVLLHLVVLSEASSVSKSCEKSCFSGKCMNGSCVCEHGWVGDQCQHCQGRFK
ncbi:hypothetical protein CesoFtcFv8_021400 [Champsocephalus esox]|uniref:EGF-like domain-containing protein n=3 Tax=Channichthyidae TaxID=30806 RepID=A0AAN8CRT8_CHAGU|nr:hypothetical protein CesoFtcFv8_021400 [Champsocephalus esox]KAK5908915.1 hypothetical protein CgunFtcFv8_016933 [Champsocephalus gunnari]